MSSLDNIGDNYLVLYAGVEFGNNNIYRKTADSIAVIASCAYTCRVWLDSLASRSKIAECVISRKGGWSNYRIFTANLVMSVSERQDLYLRFKGAGNERILCFNG
jgi:hypothetical protein